MSTQGLLVPACGRLEWCVGGPQGMKKLFGCGSEALLWRCSRNLVKLMRLTAALHAGWCSADDVFWLVLVVCMYVHATFDSLAPLALPCRALSPNGHGEGCCIVEFAGRSRLEEAHCGS